MNIPYYIGCAFDDQDEMDFRKEERRKAAAAAKRKAQKKQNEDKEDQ